MAQGRIIDTSISVSRKVNSLSDSAALLYTWMIPHLDHFSLIAGSPFDIKLLVCPARPWSIEQIGEWLDQMISLELITVVFHEGKPYYYVYQNDQKQNFRRDRQPRTILPIRLDSVPDVSWAKLSRIVDQMLITKQLPEDDGQVTTTDRQLPSEVKVSEVKVREENTSGSSPLGSLLSLKDKPSRGGASTQWQDEASRYADNLKIDLSSLPPGMKASWFKCFKESHGGKNRGNLLQAYSYVIDHPGDLDNQGKVKMFFKVWNNGLEVK